jgi:hypothetical protein
MLQTQPTATLYKGRLMTIAQIERHRKYNREKMRERRAGQSSGVVMCFLCGHQPACIEIDRLRITDSGEFRQVRVKWCGRC